MRFFFKTFGVIAVSTALLAATFISYDYFKTRQAFPPNTYIAAVDVSGLTLREAIAKLEGYPLADLFTPLITIEADTASFAFPPEKLGLEILYKETAENAFKVTHRENYFEELKGRIEEGGYYAPLVIRINENRLKDVIEAIANEIRSSPKDASIIFYEETGGYNIEGEELGREVNIEKSLKAFKSKFYQGEKVISLVIDYSYPRITEEYLRNYPPIYQLSAYTTYYGRHDSRNRIHNIKLIASWLDDTLLMPGDIFSLEEVIGEFSPERGFKEAFVIYGGELVPQFGGGTCQIGTTLYNAVSLADLKVLQRKNHSFYFNIYPLGRDATIYPGQVDFKFENDTGHPIIIKSVGTNKRLSFKIYGTPSGKKVTFSPAKIFGRTETGQYAPMTLKKVIDLDIPFKTAVTRTVYGKNGKKINEETIRSSYKLYGEKENVPIRRPEPR